MARGSPPKMLIIGLFIAAIFGLTYFALSASHGDNTVHMPTGTKQD